MPPGIGYGKPGKKKSKGKGPKDGGMQAVLANHIRTKKFSKRKSK